MTRPDRRKRPRRDSSPLETAITEPGIVSPAFSIQVTTDHLDTIQGPIPADALADLIRSLPDRPEYRPIFDLAARHPAAPVRMCVSQMENLSVGAVRLLANDPCTEVRRQLVSSRAVVQHAGSDMLLRLAASDLAVAEVLAEYLHDFTGCDVDHVEEMLAAHNDPSVRLALAGNGQISCRALAPLEQDPDLGGRPYGSERLES